MVHQSKGRVNLAPILILFVCAKAKKGYEKQSRQGPLCPFTRRLSPGSKRKALTYSGEDAICPFARCRFPASQSAITDNAFGSDFKSSIVSALSRTQKDQPPTTTSASAFVSPSESTLSSF